MKPDVSRIALEEDGWHWRKPRPGQPVFHYVTDAGSHGVVSWDTAKVWAEEIHINEASRDFYYGDLYVLFPGGKSLIPCEIVIDDINPFDWKTIIVGTTSASPGELFRES